MLCQQGDQIRTPAICRDSKTSRRREFPRNVRRLFYWIPFKKTNAILSHYAADYHILLVRNIPSMQQRRILMNCENNSGRYRHLEEQDTCIYKRACPPACAPALCLPGDAVCDIPPCASLKEVICTVNELLESLRFAGVRNGRSFLCL